MTSRERIKKACNFGIPDRIPNGLGGTRSTTFHIDAYANLVRYLGLDLLPPKSFDINMMKAHVDMEMLHWMGADVIHLESVVNAWSLPNEDYKPFTTNLNNVILVPGAFQPVKDEKGNNLVYNKSGEIIAHMSPTSDYFDIIPQTQFKNEIEHINPKDFVSTLPMLRQEHLKLMEKRAKIFFETTEFALHGNFLMYDLFGINMIGHTYTDWMILLATEPEYCEGHIKALTDWTIKNLEMYLQALGKHLHSLLISTADYGNQLNEMISPNIFSTLYKPAYKRICDHIHKNSDVKAMLHCCGSIKKLIPHFIEAGVDILNPLQLSANDMQPETLVEEFGGKIVLWGGGADTQTVLPYGTEDEIREHVKRNIRILGKNGGYVFTPTHNILPDVPPRNIVAMIETLKEFGKYPLV